MIEIKILIKDKEINDEYKDIHEDLILDDFLNDPEAWLNLKETEITVKKGEE